MGPMPFCIFLFLSHDKYSTNLTINDKSIDGVFGIRTRGGSMVGIDKFAKLWRLPCSDKFSSKLLRLAIERASEATKSTGRTNL